MDISTPTYPSLATERPRRRVAKLGSSGRKNIEFTNSGRSSRMATPWWLGLMGDRGRKMGTENWGEGGDRR